MTVTIPSDKIARMKEILLQGVSLDCLLDDASHVMLPIISQLQRHDLIIGEGRVDWSFWDNLVKEVPQLANVDKIINIQSFHIAFDREVSPMAGLSRRGGEIPQEEIKLVYSLFFNLLAPDHKENGIRRDSIKQMFSTLGLGEPLSKEKVLEKAGLLIEIRNKEERPSHGVAR